LRSNSGFDGGKRSLCIVLRSRDQSHGSAWQALYVHPNSTPGQQLSSASQSVSVWQMADEERHPSDMQYVALYAPDGRQHSASSAPQSSGPSQMTARSPSQESESTHS